MVVGTAANNQKQPSPLWQPFKRALLGSHRLSFGLKLCETVPVSANRYAKERPILSVLFGVTDVKWSPIPIATRVASHWMHFERYSFFCHFNSSGTTGCYGSLDVPQQHNSALSRFGSIAATLHAGFNSSALNVCFYQGRRSFGLKYSESQGDFRPEAGNCDKRKPRRSGVLYTFHRSTISRRRRLYDVRHVET